MEQSWHDNNDEKRDWQASLLFLPGKSTFKYLNLALVNSVNLILPLFQVKLVLIEEFLKAEDQGSAGFQYLFEKVPFS